MSDKALVETSSDHKNYKAKCNACEFNVFIGHKKGKQRNTEHQLCPLVVLLIALDIFNGSLVRCMVLKKRR